ncbi:NAD(P)/FAD-dependent oxidoreductase [Aliiroseovarius halocynthiae]|uniref:FAD-dependent oxidoreductase n=1 Tax=Aliiroseovarius halocynthiae TaxID=985055 RepID=A0A545SZH1_9RHOB|nr:FAD-dependent oxidoreductase [Aliiroseovarius halocynthiae]TQV70331.1 FAD-dependent oxidoreductase [Aliiroseovarius halocynthiae]
MMNTSYSFWEDNYGCYTLNVPLTGDHTADVVIVGGGFTGLTVAREIKYDNPSARVVVLEAQYVGFGASGRNGGFNASQFGFEPGLVKLMRGKERASEAQLYMKKAVDYVRNLSKEHELDNDYEHKGGLRIAYTPPQVARLRKTFELLNEFSPNNSEWLNAPEVQARVNSPRPQAAFFEPDVGVLDPTKHVRALKRLAEFAGAEIYENTPVTTFKRRHAGVDVIYRDGRIKAERIVIALNAWAHLFEGPRKLKSATGPKGSI